MKSQNHIQKQIFDFLTWHNLKNVTTLNSSNPFSLSILFKHFEINLFFKIETKFYCSLYYNYSVELTYSAEGDRSLMFISPLDIDSLGSSITVHF